MPNTNTTESIDSQELNGLINNCHTNTNMVIESIDLHTWIIQGE